jgi:hypothetical protein
MFLSFGGYVGGKNFYKKFFPQTPFSKIFVVGDEYSLRRQVL